MKPANASSTHRSGASAAVRVEDTWKTLGGTRILAGVDLHVEAGEFVTLLGPSGSGKTSTLMAIAGFLLPDRGRIIVGERDVTRVPPGRERDMGIVFQNYALFPHMSVAKNIAYPLAVRGLPRKQIEDKVAKAIALVQLDGLADRKPARLSGGQQQRVALARALVFEPSVLLMDEPMGALDVRLKQELQWEIRQLQRTLGTTVIYVTHDQDEAMVLSDRIALMKDGRLEQYGTPQELYRAPSSIFAARFLGESNLVSGTYRSGSAAVLEVAATHFALPLEQIRAGLSDAERCAALLRPEALTVLPRVDALPADAGLRDGRITMPGTVTEAVFIGQAIRYQIDVPALGRQLTVQQPVRADIDQLEPGDEALVQWHVGDMHLVPEDGRDA
ncbi:ABC transporter ATP-binding protein [Bosea sp. (in: a-proteobacteria)]|uniref:ABC transporter ATP-binding protein n=1 Tax=Bosea sp. (in: a-proteobacteria) TaxID=1871050 RepID=UPI00261EEDD5|nr:ABC transporter ATP-binding protein [Bosea sp. (in: a-proteobacteria)]MCO5089942.1 ABC transporter ATP-binding protein [Bosea sp. (in: a-proteobacteria)]